MRKVFPMVICVLLFISSCGPSPGALTNTDNTAPQQTHTAVPTNTPTPTLTPTQTSSPTMTPTPLGGGGGTIAFVSKKDTKGSIALYDLATGKTSFPAIQYPEGMDSPFGVDSVALSPDGTKLAFTQAICPTQGSGQGMVLCRKDLFISNIDGSDVVQLTKTNLDEDWPVWSPDGTRIGYVYAASGAADIYMVNIDGSGRKRLTDARGWDWLATWSPDGKKIAFQSQRNGGFQIYVMNADRSDGVHQLTKIKGSTCGNPAWSPDGLRIAFVAYFTKSSDLYMMGADGSNPTNLTAGKYSIVGPPTWSPDGKMLAFLCNDRVCIMNPDVASVTKVISLDYISDRSLSWSQP